MERIAVFGGTFNPVHNGHLHIAKQYAAFLKVQRLLFIPASVPPHKQVADLASAEDRLTMCRMACEPNQFEVSDLEIRRGGASYTADTLMQLKELYPNSALFLLMGEDMFLTVEHWHEVEKIFQTCTLCAAPRSKNGLDSLRRYAEKIKTLGADVILYNIEYLPVSSTMVRQAVKDGKSITPFVPARVAEYIQDKKLYRADKAGGNLNEWNQSRL